MESALTTTIDTDQMQIADPSSGRRRTGFARHLRRLAAVVALTAVASGAAVVAQPAKEADAWSVSWPSLSTISVKFNRSETRNMIYSTAGLPYNISGLVGSAVVRAFAYKTYRNGDCVKVNITWGFPEMTSWNC